MSIRGPLEIPAPDGHRISCAVTSGDGQLTSARSGTLVLMLHGIFSNKAERGRFERHSDLLVQNGCSTIAFDFRGHGDSNIADEETTLAGMVLDLKTVVDFGARLQPSSISIVASSFGASIFLLYLQTTWAPLINRVVLLNPVLDYRATFLSAQLDWGRQLFNEAGMRQLWRTGFITLEDGFRMSSKAVVEMSLLRPIDGLRNLTIPTRLIHGDADTKVPYGVSKNAATLSPLIDFKTIAGADHAFKPPAHEAESFKLSVEWICDRS